ncbi:glutathione gamma-glutamylcysteinyltransferase [Octopus bimaculoides]|uniref:glutathione gamma-glutamylcysteinyltransferase n=1 Tax=Octopus bimaculoides TaxID=37653 RepID=A0A0L8HLU8_OCTBM|nr:glutathione gamma-glutamylcysteinyltransferase [Octopus bimaculoides]XP_014771295.1 glutathione gamma-glutamylcysteinyltransferase [Octopus bimaculoides]XP_052831347.1 glutathione gamma-glutamylcysteinyltransferase [Octopus bimaculoides]XP_052831348.1 glutathione gamma-glutamylcysteinyltransferase [Octopus bimaculoides]|eukprot:XP_014771294.1 PREDICTED: glutathione gamma-glutamylcysteinyltransferase 1-like [Octopus bimaculoides]
MNTGQFFQRVLPESCISFSSEEGKTIFTEALMSGYMNCYFKLAAQFRTQDEPAYCGLSTLVMILNALEIDPGIAWKGPWRWYHENMLECCVPLEVVKVKGISLEQFTCIAQCNCLVTTVVRPEPKDEETFRNVVKSYTKRDNAFIVATYSRKVLKQTGDGHFSPIAGYHPGRDMVLIMDTARFKYPPHWIHLPSLLTAMNTQDKATGTLRGYVLLSKNTGCEHPVLFCVSSQLSLVIHSIMPADIMTFVQKWWDFLEHQSEATDCLVTITEAIGCIMKLLNDLKVENWLLDTHVLDKKCPCDLQEKFQCTKELLLEKLEKTDLYLLVSQHGEKKYKAPTCICQPAQKCENSKSSKPYKAVHNLHMVTMLLFAWPYGAATNPDAVPSDSTTAEVLNKQVLSMYVKKQILGTDLSREVEGLKNQLTVILAKVYSDDNNKVTNDVDKQDNQ